MKPDAIAHSILLASDVCFRRNLFCPRRSPVLRFNHAHLTLERLVGPLWLCRLIRFILLLRDRRDDTPPPTDAADQRLRRWLRTAVEVNWRVRARIAAVEARVRLLLRPVAAVEVAVLDLQVDGAEAELRRAAAARVALVPAPDGRVTTLHVDVFSF